jgi:hypothetical protein
MHARESRSEQGIEATLTADGDQTIVAWWTDGTEPELLRGARHLLALTRGDHLRHLTVGSRLNFAPVLGWLHP